MKIGLKNPLEGKTDKQKLDWIKGAVIVATLPFMLPLTILTIKRPVLGGIIIVLYCVGMIFLMHTEVVEEKEDEQEQSGS
jgi:hypothetical protein